VVVLLSAAFLPILGCSSKASNQTSAIPMAPQAVVTADNRDHPLAKFIEVAGFRMAETAANQLKIDFAVINHSDADITDLGLDIALRPSSAKPGDAPLAEFSVKIPSLAPQELKPVTAAAPCKLRIYELPDWQFVRASFRITSPPPTP
jgi:hypothetical protein